MCPESENHGLMESPHCSETVPLTSITGPMSSCSENHGLVESPHGQNNKQNESDLLQGDPNMVMPEVGMSCCSSVTLTMTTGSDNDTTVATPALKTLNESDPNYTTRGMCIQPSHIVTRSKDVSGFVVHNYKESLSELDTETEKTEAEDNIP